MYKEITNKRSGFIQRMRVGAGIATLLVIVVGTGVLGQQNVKLDSLNRILPGKQGVERIDILTGIVREHIFARSYPLALQITTEALGESLALGDTTRSVLLYLLKASALRRSEKLEEAAEAYGMMMPIVRRYGTQTDLATALNAYALTLQSMAEYRSAMALYLESVSVRIKIGDEESLGVVYNNIGFIYYKLKYYEKALEYYLLCKGIKDRFHSNYDRDVLYYNIALCYCFLGHADKAKEYNRQSVLACEGECRLETRITQHYMEGVIHYGLGNSAISVHEFEASYALAVTGEDYRYQSENMLYLGRLANHSEDYTKALRYLRESERCAGMHRYRLLLHDTYKEMAAAYHGKKEYRHEFINRERYIQYRDSIFGEDLVNSLLANQVDFEQARNKAVLAIRDASVARQAREQQLMRIAGASLLFVVVIFLWDIRSRRRESEHLEQQVQIRTKELTEKVYALERSSAGRVTWEAKIGQAMHNRLTRLSGLATLAGVGVDRKILGKIVALRF